MCYDNFGLLLREAVLKDNLDREEKAYKYICDWKWV